MNEEKKSNERADEIGNALESGRDVAEAIERDGADITDGILRDTDAAKQEAIKQSTNQDLQGAP